MLSLKDMDVYIQQSYFIMEYKYMVTDVVCHYYYLKNINIW